MFPTLPFNVPFEDLSWEFTVTGDVDVSTESLGLPDIPVNMALQLSWIADIAVTTQGYRTWGATFDWSLNVTATLDFAAEGVNVYLEGRTSLPAQCELGILLAGHVKIDVPNLAVDAAATGTYNCAIDDADTATYEVIAFVGKLSFGGVASAGFSITDTEIHVVADTIANGTDVGAWALNVTGMAELSGGDIAGVPAIDMSITMDAVVVGFGSSAEEVVIEINGEFTIGNDVDFEVHGNIRFNYPCNFGYVHAIAGLNLNTSSGMRVDEAGVNVAVACDKLSLPEGEPYVTVTGRLATFEIAADFAISDVIINLQITENKNKRRFAGSFHATVDASNFDYASGFQISATVNFDVTLSMKQALPPSDAPPSCSTSDVYEFNPKANLTGFGAAAAITEALTERSSFGGDVDGFYQRQGCGLDKVSVYTYKCGWTVTDMKSVCASNQDCVGFIRYDATIAAYSTGCGFTVMQNMTVRTYDFFANKNISGSPPVVSNMDADAGADAFDGYYFVKEMWLGIIAAYTEVGASCGVSTHEQKMDCDTLQDCVGFTRLPGDGCAYYITQDSSLRAYDLYLNKELTGLSPAIAFSDTHSLSHATYGGQYAGTYLAQTSNILAVAGYLDGACAITLAAAKALCDAMATPKGIKTCAGIKYLRTGCFSYVINEGELRKYVLRSQQSIAGTNPAVLSEDYDESFLDLSPPPILQAPLPPPLPITIPGAGSGTCCNANGPETGAIPSTGCCDSSSLKVVEDGARCLTTRWCSSGDCVKAAKISRSSKCGPNVVPSPSSMTALSLPPPVPPLPSPPPNGASACSDESMVAGCKCGKSSGDNGDPDNPYPSTNLCCDQATKKTKVGMQLMSYVWCKTTSRRLLDVDSAEGYFASLSATAKNPLSSAPSPSSESCCNANHDDMYIKLNASAMVALYDGVYLKQNTSLWQVASYGDKTCGVSIPAAKRACDEATECVGFSYASTKQCYTFVLEEYEFTQGMAWTGAYPAALTAMKAGANTRPESGLYTLKHRAKLHRVRSYGVSTCGLTIAQQKNDCDGVYECAGFVRLDNMCSHLILEVWLPWPNLCSYQASLGLRV